MIKLQDTEYTGNLTSVRSMCKSSPSSPDRDHSARPVTKAIRPLLCGLGGATGQGRGRSTHEQSII